MRLSVAGVGKTIVAAAMLAVAVLIAAVSRQGAPPRTVSERAAVSKTRSASEACPGELVIPVAGVAAGRLVDTFDDARSEGRRHDALDIMAPRGAAVVAAGEGRLEKLFFSRAGGNTVYVRSPDGRLLYYYAHLDSYAPGLREGQAVPRGMRLGTVGATGNANPAAPHLHFAMMATSPTRKWWEAASALNPFDYLRGGGGLLSGDCAESR